MLLGRLAPLPATTGRDDTDRRRLQARTRRRIEPGMKSTGAERAHADRTPAPASARSTEPYRQLMAAVLQAVVDDYQGGSDRRRRAGCRPIDSSAVRKAAAYVRSTDRAWPFSFENLCEALGLDAFELRSKLAGLRRRGILHAEAARSAPAERHQGERVAGPLPMLLAPPHGACDVDRSSAGTPPRAVA